jgi:hypothetical protein
MVLPLFKRQQKPSRVHEGKFIWFISTTYLVLPTSLLRKTKITLLLTLPHAIFHLESMANFNHLTDMLAYIYYWNNLRCAQSTFSFV